MFVAQADGYDALTSTAGQVADEVARRSYGKLLAVVAAKGGDIVRAEDALAEAFARALKRWPTHGVPDNPEGWLLAVARNQDKDVVKSAGHQKRTDFDETFVAPDEALANLDVDQLADRRLELLFVCAHPAIQASIRTPLMLQTVLGLEAREIATAFAMPASALAQRLVRAKKKIKAARIPFLIPAASKLADRLPSVLEAVYGCYAVGWCEPADRDLGDEALFLSQLLLELMPEQQEVAGLHALICFSVARRDARFDRDGALIPLDKQDCLRWNEDLMTHAEAVLDRAANYQTPGRFQLEAAIQSVHAARRKTGQTFWPAIAQLHEGLMKYKPTLGSAVARAAARGKAISPQEGLAALAEIPDDAVQAFQPYWATRAHLNHDAGELDDAMTSLKRAIALTTETPLRLYLESRRALWRH